MRLKRFERQNLMKRRIWIIDKAIADGEKSRDELQEVLRKNGFLVGHATVSRDLLTLKEWGGRWEKTSDFKYYYPEQRCSLSYHIKVREDSAKLTQTVLESLKGNPFYEEIAPGFNRRTRKNNLSDRIIFLGVPMAEIQSEVWIVVKQAITEDKLLKFNYQARSSKNGEFYTHTVHPYQLIFDSGNWNLYGLDFAINKRENPTKDKTRLFALAGMKDLELRKREDSIILPSDFDYRTRIIGTFGCYADETTANYKIHFSGYAAKFVQDKIWVPGQVITPDEEHEGEIYITFTSNQSKPILNWIMQWSPDAYPIEPDELVSEWKKRVQETWERMRGKIDTDEHR